MQTYKDIKYSLSKSDRKTASIYIERDGSISVLAPVKWNQDQLEEVLETKRPWIYRSLAEWEDLNSTRVPREFVSGEGFLYLGRAYRLRIVEKQSKPLILKSGYFYMSTNGLETPFESFKEFYRTKGHARLKERVDYYKVKMGVEPDEVRVMELQNRWASCSDKKNINFHWKCLMAPLRIIDYVVAHELAHLKHNNHTNAFWGEVDKVMHDYRERKEWLKQYGAGMAL